MKTYAIIPLLLALPAFAGTSKEVIAPAQTEPSLWSWFTGASVGYLTELEEPMYHLHLGADTPWKVAGWDIALFAEVGYTEKDDSFQVDRRDLNIIAEAPGGNQGGGNQGGGGGNQGGGGGGGNIIDVDTELRIIPVTANVKFERALTGNLNAYFGAGVGMANVDFSVSAGGVSADDDDWVFCAQVFAGLVYNVSPAFEVYGGGRWLYFDDASLFGADLDMDDDFLIELGARYNF